MNNLSKSLSTRHVVMIALGSAIGTGLFFNSGELILLTGPSLILTYIINGLLMYIVIRALGEMAVYDPSPGSFSYYAQKYVNPYFGFISGWNYWFNYIIVCMTEATAGGIFFKYWFPNFPIWEFSLIVLILLSIINFVNVKFFGEFEFWFATIKVITIIAFIIFGTWIIIKNNDIENSKITIKNLWQYSDFFINNKDSFYTSIVIAIFSFGGLELIGITAAETNNPKKSIPLAINGIIIRILLFYILTTLIILCLYPWKEISKTISPFVFVFNQMGIYKVATIMNIVAITAALSSLNSGIYGNARMLYNLSVRKSAPFFLSKLNNNQIPYYAVIVSIICIFLVVILNYLFEEKIFYILISIAIISAVINWLLILITHFYFKLKNKNIHEYKLFLYPFTSIIAFLGFIFILFKMASMESMKMAIYVGPIWILIISCLYFINKFLRKNSK